MESKYAKAKSQYSQSLKNLEVISEEIHNKRKENTKQRGECVGAESTTPPPSTPPSKPKSSRRRSTLRRASEEKIKTALVRQRSQPPEGLWRYRHSLLLDLDVNFDIGNDEEMDLSLRSPNAGPSSSLEGGAGKPPMSPGAKSVDIGCVSMKYYDDYQVLDIGPFLDKHRNSKRRESEHVGNRVRANSEFDDIQFPPSGGGAQDPTTTVSSNSNDARTDQRKHSHAVVITMDDLKGTHHHHQHITQKVALNSHFSVIDEDATAEEDLNVNEETRNETRCSGDEQEDSDSADPEKELNVLGDVKDKLENSNQHLDDKAVDLSESVDPKDGSDAPSDVDDKLKETDLESENLSSSVDPKDGSNVVNDVDGKLESSDTHQDDVSEEPFPDVNTDRVHPKEHSNVISDNGKVNDTERKF